VPPNITLIPLPEKCPELNPQENVWQFLRDNWLSKPNLQILPRRRRPLLRGLEQPRRSTLADHVHRPSQLGPWVLINESWYSSFRMGCLLILNAAQRAFFKWNAGAYHITLRELSLKF
jgi:hypothetical protein